HVTNGYVDIYVYIKDSLLTPMLDIGDPIVKIEPARVALDDVVCVHVDVEESEAATAKAIEFIDTADLGDEDAELAVGDALDNFMAYYDVSELPFLVELL